MNELLLFLDLLLLYGGIILFYRFFGKDGLYGFIVLATILANIEVLLIVNAFGMEMTLGNILFACTYLITDILSENYGKKEAGKAVVLSTAGAILFVVMTQMWLCYVPASSDWAGSSFRILFANTPRLVLASLSVYAITQMGDVWLYHKWWDWSTKRLGDSRKALWLRNNGSTLVSQMLNTVLYNVFAFAGIYSGSTLTGIIISSYVIFIFTSLLDTPVVYICRALHDRRPEL